MDKHLSELYFSGIPSSKWSWVPSCWPLEFNICEYLNLKWMIFFLCHTKSCLRMYTVQYFDKWLCKLIYWYMIKFLKPTPSQAFWVWFFCFYSLWRNSGRNTGNKRKVRQGKSFRINWVTIMLKKGVFQWSLPKWSC